ncbi:uncharacterized protein LOC141837321 [Curcuma longa]|uniref:uncharacterized protein LOC141837321 n=1 Tax=Curcuma longa TaxID=136217 RepID=UPI003D9EF58E
MANLASASSFLDAHKKVSLTRLRSGAEQVSVAIDLVLDTFKMAYDVSLSDDSWPQDRFALVSGSTSNTCEQLDVGSSASLSFTFESNLKGVFHGSAVVKFRIPTKAALQEAYSTPVLPFDVLVNKPPEKKFAFLVAAPSKANTEESSKKRR